MAESVPLVAIDLQQIFARPDSPWASPDYATAAAGVERLLPAFGDDVLFTRFVAPGSPAGAWTAYYAEWAFALAPDDDPLYGLTPPFDRLARRIQTRPTFGKWDAGLAAELGHPAEIVLTGVSTDCCVLSTALAAADAGVLVRIPVDACAGATPEDHRRALDAMALYAPLIQLTTVDEVLATAV